MPCGPSPGPRGPGPGGRAGGRQGGGQQREGQGDNEQCPDRLQFPTSPPLEYGRRSRTGRFVISIVVWHPDCAWGRRDREKCGRGGVITRDTKNVHLSTLHHINIMASMREILSTPGPEAPNE